MRFELPAVVVLIASCSGGKDTDRADPQKPAGDQVVTFVAADAGPNAIGSDQGDSVAADRPAQPQPLPNRERRAIDVTLRSTPPGARVAVDGTSLGVAPAFWSGYADGREHEFTFMLPKHAIARYRFVPVASGVIHARLEPIVEERDAGVAPPPEVAPHPQASAIAPPPAPPVIVPDAAVAVPPAARQGSGQGSSAPTPAVGPQP